MKKTAKTITAMLLVITIINKLMFLKKIPSTGKKYKWKHGDVHYKTYGQKQPLLLLHNAFPGSGRHEFDKNIKALSAHFKVYAIDLPGYGLSDKPRITYTAYIYAKFILDFIRDVVKEPVYVAASGSAAAFTVMANALDKEHFKRIMLINPAGIDDPLPENKNKFLQRLIESPVIGTMIYNIASCRISCRLFLKKHCFSNEGLADDKRAKQYSRSAHANGTGGKYAYGSYISHFMNTDVKNQLTKIKIPVYVVWGEELAVKPSSHFYDLKEQLPKAQTAIFQKTKLLPHVENNSAFNDICIEFFKEPF